MAPAGSPDQFPGLINPKHGSKRKPKIKWTAENDRQLLLYGLGKEILPHEFQAIADSFPEKPSAKAIQERLVKLRGFQQIMLAKLQTAIGTPTVPINPLPEEEEEEEEEDDVLDPIFEAVIRRAQTMNSGRQNTRQSVGENPDFPFVEPDSEKVGEKRKAPQKTVSASKSAMRPSAGALDAADSLFVEQDDERPRKTSKRLPGTISTTTTRVRQPASISDSEDTLFVQQNEPPRKKPKTRSDAISATQTRVRPSASVPDPAEGFMTAQELLANSRPARVVRERDERHERARRHYAEQLARQGQGGGQTERMQDQGRRQMGAGQLGAGQLGGATRAGGTGMGRTTRAGGLETGFAGEEEHYEDWDEFE